MRVIDAKFIKSSQSIKDSLATQMGEVAFLGRSNVGKSSLLNSLTNRKSLAKSSNTPGKTRLINFFDITLASDDGDERYFLRFVDLPGFGFAKVSKVEKRLWQKNLTEFLLKREAIRIFIQLIDSRHPELDIDIETNDFLNSIKRGDQIILKVYTKTDKLNQRELQDLKSKCDSNSIFISNLKHRGIDELRDKITDYMFKEF
jgi:GTP-binding protein